MEAGRPIRPKFFFRTEADLKPALPGWVEEKELNCEIKGRIGKENEEFNENGTKGEATWKELNQCVDKSAQKEERDMRTGEKHLIGIERGQKNL